MAEKWSFDPLTGKLTTNTRQFDNYLEKRVAQKMNSPETSGFFGGCMSMPEDRSTLECNPDYATCAGLPSFSVETIHISCKSDAYQGSKYSYAGVVIYSCDGKSQWQTANGTRCKSGYLVIMDTATGKVKQYMKESPGQVHGAVYRSAFGEECTARNVNAEGFSVMNGVFKINSGVFNPAEDGYHDDKRSMHPLSASCIREVVYSWMNARERFYECRNFKVKDLQ